MSRKTRLRLHGAPIEFHVYPIFLSLAVPIIALLLGSPERDASVTGK
jgi:hypothetical protein